MTLHAKHANNKAAKKANHNRPRKSRPSDINRKPVVYDEIIKPPEYTIIDGEYEPPSDEAEETYIDCDFSPNLKMIMNGDEHMGWRLQTEGVGHQSNFEPVDWTRVSQGMEVANEPAEDDEWAWLENQSHEDAMAWIQSKLDNVEPVSNELNDELKQFMETGPTEAQLGAFKEWLTSGSSDAAGGSALSLENLELPPDAELVEFVDDKEVVWE